MRTSKSLLYDLRTALLDPKTYYTMRRHCAAPRIVFILALLMLIAQAQTGLCCIAHAQRTYSSSIQVKDRLDLHVHLTFNASPVSQASIWSNMKAAL